MAEKKPESEEDIEKLVYFTQRRIDGGYAVAWVYRQKCAKCNKGLMGKPRDDKTGKAKIRSPEYVCPECGNSVEKNEYEETLTANIEYKCPECGNESVIQIPYRRKSFQGVKALVFECEKCGEKIAITKKMKEPKKKKKGVPSDFDDD